MGKDVHAPCSTIKMLLVETGTSLWHSFLMPHATCVQCITALLEVSWSPQHATALHFFPTLNTAPRGREEKQGEQSLSTVPWERILSTLLQTWVVSECRTETVPFWSPSHWQPGPSWVAAVSKHRSGARTRVVSEPSPSPVLTDSPILAEFKLCLSCPEWYSRLSENELPCPGGGRSRAHRGQTTNYPYTRKHAAEWLCSTSVALL